MPEDSGVGNTYQVQYGRLFLFTITGNQNANLRLPAGLAANVRLDALISGVGTGPLTFRLDVGADGTWDWTAAQTVTDSVALASPDLSSFFNAYWSTHGAPSSGTIDVPVRVSLDKPGQVLLTNLQVTPGGSKLRAIRLETGVYSSVTLNYTLSGGSGPVTVALDVGDDGVIDDSVPLSPAAYPVTVTTKNLASVVNAYLAGKPGEVDVPIRFFVAPDHGLALASFSAALAGRPDLSVAPPDIHLPASPVESDKVALSATVHNGGGVKSGGLAVSFFATPPGGSPWFVGADYLPGVAPGGASDAQITFDTLGFSGAVTVQVVVDPSGRVTEGSEGNNAAQAPLAILTRADLNISALDQPEADLAVTQEGAVRMTLRNDGDTPAPDALVSLYDGNPASGGVLIHEEPHSASAGSQTDLSFAWTPSVPGPHRLFVVTDRQGVVNEANKSNNLAWKDVYVGLKSPLLIDSGAPSDLPYAPNPGYGYVESGKPDVTSSCGAGALPEETLRRDPDGKVTYQFNNLAPAHAYHLDLVLYECDGAGRQESVVIDSYTAAGPVDLGDGQVHRLSLLVDPALYIDRQLVVDVTAPGITGAVVGAINLHDVDYRYIDAGSAFETPFTPEKGSGWVDPASIASVAWGRLPYQSARVDQNDSDLTYRFDRLKPASSYRLHLTFWQKEGSPFIQKVWIGATDTNQVVNTGDFLVHRVAVPVPASEYQGDGSITVKIERLGASGAMLNEIALEEVTVAQSSGTEPNKSPYFTEVYGEVVANVGEDGAGTPAPVGTEIVALSPRGDIVGTFRVGDAGHYGFMRIYGEDTSVIPNIPGMRAGELVTFKVNGAPAVSKPSFYWQSDYQTHPVNLSAGNIAHQELLLARSWNFISFNREPASPLLENVLYSIINRYDRVLSERQVYSALPGGANTLVEMHAGQGYFIYISGNESARLMVDGLPQAANTPIALHRGWNWVGYLPSTGQPVADALASIAGHYQLVHSFGPPEIEGTYNPTRPDLSTLHTLEPGYGYMIYVDADCTLVYPEPSGPQSVSEPRAAVGVAKVSPTPWMTVVYGSVLLNGQPAPANTRVGVRSQDGALAGYFVVTAPGVLGYTHVYGDPAAEGAPLREGDVMSFTVNGVPAVTGEVLIFNPDLDLHEVHIEAEQHSLFLPQLTIP